MNTELLKPILGRKSVFAFDPKPLTHSQIDTLFDAARWAPSSYNEQPWRFYYASRATPESFLRLLSTLMPPNRKWAKDASLLVVSAARKISGVTGKENLYAIHDTALAEANLMLQAQHMGFVTHPMGGFSHSKVRDVASIPDDYHVVAVLAVGYQGDEATLSPELLKRATAPRERKPLVDLAMEL